MLRDVCVWARFDHKRLEMEEREVRWIKEERTPDPYVHFTLELLLFLTVNGSGDGQAQLARLASAVLTDLE